MKKGIVLAISLIFLFATSSVAFAGDIIFSPIIEKPAPGEMDTYIIAGDRGTEVVHVYDVGDDAYAVVNDGETTVIFKVD